MDGMLQVMELDKQLMLLSLLLVLWLGLGLALGMALRIVLSILLAMLSPLPLPPALLCPLPLMEPGQPLLLALLLRLGQGVMGQRMDKLEWGQQSLLLSLLAIRFFIETCNYISPRNEVFYIRAH